MYTVLPELYLEAAARLTDAIGSENYFSGSVVFSSEGVDCRLTTSVIVYRQRISLPEGEQEKIVKLVPVWWEFHTFSADGEMPNDFSFSDMCPFV